MIDKKDLEQILKTIQAMTPEEYKSQFLHLNGTMTENIFDEVVEYVSEHNLIDSDIVYKDELLNEKFMDVFHYIDAVAKDYKIPAESEWSEDFIYFSYKEKNYIWRIVMGQGSYCVIYTDIVGDRNRCEIKIDPTIKFYKVINEKHI